MVDYPLRIFWKQKYFMPSIESAVNYFLGSVFLGVNLDLCPGWFWTAKGDCLAWVRPSGKAAFPMLNVKVKSNWCICDIDCYLRIRVQCSIEKNDTPYSWRLDYKKTLNIGRKENDSIDWWDSLQLNEMAYEAVVKWRPLINFSMWQSKKIHVDFLLNSKWM